VPDAEQFQQLHPVPHQDIPGTQPVGIKKNG
jgi:hypothetical protein